jgi:PAS domain S-box-containing protein
MPKHDEFSSGAAKGSPSGCSSRPTGASRFEQFEKRQNELWRLTFILLLILSIVFAFTSWSTIRSLALRFEALPIGLVVLVVLFGLYAWKRTQEISELRGLVRGLEHHEAAPPSDKQMDQLLAVISRSQQGYRDLIDSFDDILIALSLEGEIRAVNQSFADLVGASFQQIIGRPVTDFLEEGGGEGAELIRRAMPRFVERRHWSGIIQVRLKKQNSVCYFDCVAHAMTRDNKVHGLTVLGRDITALRKNEARFTELFETLQEGIYIAIPDGSIPTPILPRPHARLDSGMNCSANMSRRSSGPCREKIAREEVERQSSPQGHEITLLRDGSRRLSEYRLRRARTSGRVIRYQVRHGRHRPPPDGASAPQRSGICPPPRRQFS